MYALTVPGTAPFTHPRTMYALTVPGTAPLLTEGRG